MRRRPLAVLRQELLAVNGVGQETADSILLYALGKPVFVVDAYTKRVFSRHGCIGEGARYERVQAEVGPGVTVVAATKYVPLGDMAVLAEAGIEVVGENRAQDLEAKHAAFGDAFRRPTGHFLGLRVSYELQAAFLPPQFVVTKIEGNPP